MRWIQVAPAEDIPPRKGLAILIGHLSLAVFNTGERFLAVENRCPHSGDPLADGMVTGTTVTCPRHSWRICLETGLVTKPSVEGTPQVRTFPADVRDGTVMLDLDAVTATRD
jgi:nitrite reductase (NADH) small subunit